MLKNDSEEYQMCQKILSNIKYVGKTWTLSWHTHSKLVLFAKKTHKKKRGSSNKKSHTQREQEKRVGINGFRKLDFTQPFI